MCVCVYVCGYVYGEPLRALLFCLRGFKQKKLVNNNVSFVYVGSIMCVGVWVYVRVSPLSRWDNKKTKTKKQQNKNKNNNNDNKKTKTTTTKAKTKKQQQKKKKQKKIK